MRSAGFRRSRPRTALDAVKRIPVERKSGVDAELLGRELRDGTARPVVVTDAMRQWRAMERWEFAFFREAFGADFVSAPLGLFSEFITITKLATYIDYLDSPDAGLPGFGIHRRNGKRRRSVGANVAGVHYPLLWPAFRQHPELVRDIQPAPYFVSDWQLGLERTVIDSFERACGREYYSIYMGPPGGVSRLHADFWKTHAYLAQVRGSKKCYLFSPEDEPLLYDGEADPERPDFDRHQLFLQATAHECVIGPGEMLFIPGGWWHHVRSLDKTITVSHNFFNETNFSEHMRGVLGHLGEPVDRAGEGA